MTIYSHPATIKAAEAILGSDPQVPPHILRDLIHIRLRQAIIQADTTEAHLLGGSVTRSENSTQEHRSDDILT
jgi:hypothetical protein